MAKFSHAAASCGLGLLHERDPHLRARPVDRAVANCIRLVGSQATVGLTVATFINAICVPIGALVDRLGPRFVGLVGVLLTSLAFALIGTATGGSTNWSILWAVLAFATLPVSSRFIGGGKGTRLVV